MRLHNKAITTILASIILCISLFAQLHAMASEDYCPGTVSCMAKTLYTERKKKQLHAFQLSIQKRKHQEIEQCPNPELYLDTTTHPSTLHISCLFLSYEDFERSSYMPPAQDSEEISLTSQLPNKIAYYTRHAPPLAEDEMMLWPTMLRHVAILQGNTQLYRKLTAQRPFLWPEECYGLYDRHLLRPDTIELKKIDDNAIALTQPIIRQWPQEDAKSPPYICFELLCMVYLTS